MFQIQRLGAKCSMSSRLVDLAAGTGGLVVLGTIFKDTKKRKADKRPQAGDGCKGETSATGTPHH